MRSACSLAVLIACAPDHHDVPVDAAPDAPMHCDIAGGVSGSAYGYSFGVLTQAAFSPLTGNPDAGNYHPATLHLSDGTLSLDYMSYAPPAGTCSLKAPNSIPGVKMTSGYVSGGSDNGCVTAAIDIRFDDGGSFMGVVTIPRN